MADLGNFNANNVDPLPDLEPLPAGQYVVVATESEMKPTKAGTGAYLEIKFQVIEGDHQGRPVWARFNLANPNETAVQIAKAELAALCRAVGVLQPRDSCELHNLPVVVKVRCKRRPDTDEITNEIKGYTTRMPVAAQPPQAPPPPSTPPWRR